MQYFPSFSRGQVYTSIAELTFNVTQGHRQRHDSIEHIRLPIIVSQ